MMTDRELIKNLKKLDKIQPSKHWLVLLRRNLIARVDYDIEIERERSERFGFLFGWLGSFQSTALAVSLVFIFVFGPWLAIKAAENSLPGDLLYSVKKASEDVQKTVANSEEKPRLQVEFASRRLEELSRVNQDIDDSSEKTEKSKEIIIDFRDNLASVSQQIKDISSKDKAVIVAKETMKLSENLAKAKSEASSEVKDDIAEAEKSIEKINEEILTVLTSDNKGENDESAATTTLDQEIIIYLRASTSTDEEVLPEN